MVGNQLAQAMKDAKLISEIPARRNGKKKQFKCHKCGSPMIKIENTNTMACSNCRNFFVFDR